MTEVRVVHGPATEVDAGSLARLLREWTRNTAVRPSLVLSDSITELRGEIERARRYPLVLDINTTDDDIVVTTILDRRLPTALVDIRRRDRHDRLVVEDAGVTVIRGRGIAGYRWAVQHVANRAAWPFETIAYGSSPDQAGDLRVPVTSPPYPVAVLLHGGSWSGPWTRDLMDGLAVELARRGFASWNIEYRRIGQSGGGWPMTFDDVSRAIDFVVELKESRRLDFGDVILVGHSAGAQLALWAAAAAGATDPPFGPIRIRPALVLSLAGVVDLVATAERSLGGEDAVPQLLGGHPDEVPDRYARACPTMALPIGVRQIVVQGLRDSLVDLVDLAATYVVRARAAGDMVTHLELEEADHFNIIDPQSRVWRRIAQELELMLAE